MALPAISVAQRVGRLDLAAMAAQRVDARIERRVRALAPHRSTSAPVTSADWNSALGLEQAGQRIGGRELRAVEQRQPFLGAEHDRRRARRWRGASAAGMRPAGDEDTRRRRSSPPSYAPAARDRRRRRPSLAPGTTGMTSVREHALRAARSSPAARRRRPAPGSRASAPSSAARSATGIGSPTPAACDSTMLRCSVARSAVGDAHAGQLAEAGVDAVDRLALARRCAATASAPASTAARQAGSSAARAPR